MIEVKEFRKRPEPERPVFPKRAVVTAGMPYGNKELHFGHIGGVFIHADVFSRFLRDRIGKENVVFVSGTDCYGSVILESYRKACEENGYKGSIEDYVYANHLVQKKTLDDYEIGINLFATSAFGRSGEIHDKVSEEVFYALYEKGYLDKLSTPQFFDPDYKVLLNGRQVVGECPIEGCKSERGYADECSLGHQYMPSELINPKSALSGKTPEIIKVTNWYFKLEEFQKLLKDRVDYLRKNTNTRKYLLNTMEEFLREPMIYIKKNQLPKLREIIDKLPPHEYIEEEKKPSVTLVFKTLRDREEATEIISRHGVNFRTGKTLVPFRLTGNIEWGVKTPVKDGLENLTFWVWPESLWAPISFTKTYLESSSEVSSKDWRDWWCSKDANVYQFIGEDNIYFYGIAEMAMFMALNKEAPEILPKDGELILPHLIANNHVLFMDKKASSSSDIKPPMAAELLQYYTNEQLRMHFISLGLDNKSVSFQPAVYQTEEVEGIDPVLKEGNLLTNVYNRLIRSCFYTAQKYYDSHIPEGKVSDEILEEARKVILKYERHMYNHEFHRISDLLDSYIRSSNKYYVNNIRTADNNDDDALRRQVLIDSFHAVRVAATLVHPLAPSGADMVREYLGVDERIWDWKTIFEPLDYFIPDMKEHKLKFLEPRVDFFKKHESQLG
ncbi:MAG TPA: class I tRNA ligase family protein [Clostridiales bacterium]|jgi:methionyl-tRNA synthetase|nr:class I tRNA ligase family protein [Clostridiales bacterium]